MFEGCPVAFKLEMVAFSMRENHQRAQSVSSFAVTVNGNVFEVVAELIAISPDVDLDRPFISSPPPKAVVIVMVALGNMYIS